jgi:hypothetical protein
VSLSAWPASARRPCQAAGTGASRAGSRSRRAAVGSASNPTQRRFRQHSGLTLLDLQVTEHGPHARVVTITGEIDALTGPKLGAMLTAQLAATSVLVIDLARVRFSGSAGLSVFVCGQ